MTTSDHLTSGIPVVLSHLEPSQLLLHSSLFPLAVCALLCVPQLPSSRRVTTERSPPSGHGTTDRTQRTRGDATGLGGEVPDQPLPRAQFDLCFDMKRPDFWVVGDPEVIQVLGCSRYLGLHIYPLSYGEAGDTAVCRCPVRSSTET